MPTVIISDNTSGADFSGVEDCVLRNAAPTTNTNNSTIGADAWDVGDNNRSLLRFTGLSNIPASATVTSVTLTLNMNDPDTGNNIEFYRCLRNWVETQATWNEFSAGNSWATAGGRGTGDSSASASLASAPPLSGDVNFSGAGLVADVQAWVDGSAANNGWLIKHALDPAASGLFLDNPTVSSEGTDGLRPRLSVTYTGGGPTISSVSDATIEPGQTGIVITGSGFSPSGNTVKISPTNNVNDVNAVTQTITAQSTTSITFTGVRGSLSFETGCFLFVTTNSALSNASGTSVQFVARPFVRENLISETGAAVASETGITMVVYHSVPTTGSPNPAQVITGVASNGTGAIDVQLARGSLALNAPVWVVLMKDGSPAKGTVRKVTPVYE